MPDYVVVLNNGRIYRHQAESIAEMQAWWRTQKPLIGTPSLDKNVKFWYDRAEAFKARQQLLALSRVALPDVIRLEATNRCNAKCVFCPRDTMTRPKGIMSLGLYHQLVDQCVELKIRRISMHNYGEALLDVTLAEKVAYAKAQGISEVTLITNGSLLTESRADALIEAGLDYIEISLDAGTAAAFEANRVGLSFETVSTNIRGLVRRRTIKKSRTPRISVSFIYQQNNRELEAFVHEWQGKVDLLRSEHIHNWSILHAPRQVFDFPCLRLWQTMTVLWDGRVSLCCVDLDGQHILGDLHTQTISEVWYSDRYKQVREEHLLHNGPTLCQTCDLPVPDPPTWIADVVQQSK